MSRPFADVIKDLEGGAIEADLTQALSDLVSQVRAIRKAGTIDLKLKISPNGERSIEIISSMKVNMPEPGRPKTIMFQDDHGGLRRDDPRQIRMPLREVPEAGTKELEETTTEAKRI